jgi:hypothetical protein
MGLMRSRITHGSKIFLGRISGTGRFRLRLSLLKRITLIKRILMRIGRTRRMRSLSRTY